jgi:putative peptide zinc metalloprotease protein
MAGSLGATNTQENNLSPILRQDLTIYPSESDTDGAPAWVLHDPLANKYYRLGQREIELLSLIGKGDVENISEISAEQSGNEITVVLVNEMFEFLRRNNLVIGDAAQQTWYKRQELQLQRVGLFAYFARSYLFIRIPLWHPDNFLDKTLPYLLWLGSRTTLNVLTAIMLVGLFLVTRQADIFATTFLHFFNWTGVIAVLVSIVCVKVLHELGHAYVAKAMGCHVPVIGIAFLVGWPVLYTDTSDAWKLQSRSQRMIISAAGIGVELGVAAICLFSWSMAPEGIVRSVLFLLSTTTWVMSVLININPLMRFDGYYLFSDWLGVPNLEHRSFALAKWWIREQLFNFRYQPPEPVQMRLIFFAICVWFYRFLLFLGIALLVYNFFFKVVGIILFALEIAYFIIRPISLEIREWWKLRNDIHWNVNTVRASFVLLVALVLGFIPWSHSISMPAIYEVAYTTVYNPVSGKIKSLSAINGVAVNKGDILMELEAPELTYEVAQVKLRYDEVRWSRDSLGFDLKQRREALIVATELKTQYQRIRGLMQKLERLILRAPYSGVTVDRMHDIKVGDWLHEGVAVFSILNKKERNVTAYILEERLQRLKPGQTGTFYPEKGSWPAFKVEVSDIEFMGLKFLNSPYQASLYGGDVAVREQNNGELLPVKGTYKVHLKAIDNSFLPQQIIRGTIKVKSEAESFIFSFMRRVLALFRRESGF